MGGGCEVKRYVDRGHVTLLCQAAGTCSRSPGLLFEDTIVDSLADRTVEIGDIADC